jgi:hypothetical protein
MYAQAVCFSPDEKLLRRDTAVQSMQNMNARTARGGSHARRVVRQPRLLR